MTKNLFICSAFALSLVASSAVQAGEDISLSVDAGFWLMGWDQSDQPQSEINQPLVNKFEIEDALVMNFSIFGSVLLPDNDWLLAMPFGFAYQTMASGEDSLSKEQLELTSMAGLLGMATRFVNMNYQYRGAETSGTSRGYDPTTLQLGNVDYDTSVTMHEVRFQPPGEGGLSGLLLGYRNTQKTIPQSLYVMLNSTTLSPAAGAKQIDPALDWNVDYLVVGYSNLLFSELNREGGLGIELIYGMGTAHPSSGVIDSANVADKVNDGDATLIEVAIDYRHHFQIGGFMGKGTIGYRYMNETMETASNDSVHIHAKSESTFSGPYLNISGLF